MRFLRRKIGQQQLFFLQIVRDDGPGGPCDQGGPGGPGDLHGLVRLVVVIRVVG